MLRGVLMICVSLLAGASARAETGDTCAGAEAAPHPIVTRKPVLGDEARMVSGFGIRMHPLLQEKRMHIGVDWSAPTGTPVVAAGSGRVRSAARDGAYGKHIIIDHGGSWETLYAQLDSMAVKDGDCVTAGTKIGAVGSTGLSAGPHLHYEVHKDGRAIDPLSVRVGETDDAAQ